MAASLTLRDARVNRANLRRRAALQGAGGDQPMFRLARNTSHPLSPAVRALPPATALGPARFRVVEEAATGQLRLHLRGELGLAATPTLRDHVRSAAARHASVAIELSGVEFIDVAGLCALTALMREAHEQGRRLELRHPSFSVRQLVRLTGVHELLA
jgi:anti-sigma B factor antagonist